MPPATRALAFAVALVVLCESAGQPARRRSCECSTTMV